MRLLFFKAACAWFLKIVLVCMSVCVCVCVRVCVYLCVLCCVCVCVCVLAPEAINNQWPDMV